AQVQRRIRRVVGLQQQGDENAANTPVAVAERVNGFELVVNERQSRQANQTSLLWRRVDVAFQTRDQLGYALRGRGNEPRLVRILRAADEVLHVAELTGLLLATTNTPQQAVVNAANEASRDG